MELYTLKYFNKNVICADDFKSTDKTAMINLKAISSLTELEPFILIFSGKHVNNYATLTMTNNDRYYIREETYEKLKNNLVIIT